MQDKIHEKLLNLAEQLGGDDHAVSMHDYCEGYNARDEAIAVGNSLVELIGKESFIGYIMENPELMEAYIRGYVSSIQYNGDIPEDINEGEVESISVHLTDEQQNRVKKLAQEKLNKQ